MSFIESDKSSNESTSDSIDQLVDADKANDVVPPNLEETTPKTNSNTKYYNTTSSKNFSKLVNIMFWLIILVFFCIEML